MADRQIPQLVGLTLVLTGCAVMRANAQVRPEELPGGQQSEETPYVAGNLLVKFTQEAVRVVEQAREGGEPFHAGIESLDRLFAKYGVTAMEPVFPASRGSSPASPAPANFGLSRIYTLHLGSGQDVVEAASEFTQDPHVEYAQPNYMATTNTTQDPRP